ncbi:MAG: hypothetical protein HHJ16_06820 [Polaromonas sp.]|uniref:hypothetical protein n=1 Tax=Polaromonas sp. TaxID=1869339 RepID=UPI0017FA9017|nr:hypothetical protein [Polaromonas sp.]NMM09968.1 hypothetical protein [Polaromonas sp.]
MSNFQSYSAYVPEEEIFQTHGPQIREEMPVHRVTSAGNIITESSDTISRGNSGHESSEGWEATARSTAGRAISAADINPDTLISFDGMQAKASFWVSEGRLTKGADGTYVAGSGPVEAPQNIQGDISYIPDAVMEGVNAALEPLPQESLEMITAQGIGVALGRLDDASLTRKFSQASGLELADSQQRLTAIKAVYQQQADSAIQSRSGIGAADAPEFWAWAKANHQGQLQDAINKQLRSADVGGYKALADNWLSSTPPSLNALRAGGVPVRTNGSGVHECQVNGHWMTPAAAARAGLV